MKRIAIVAAAIVALLLAVSLVLIGAEPGPVDNESAGAAQTAPTTAAAPPPRPANGVSTATEELNSIGGEIGPAAGPPPDRSHGSGAPPPDPLPSDSASASKVLSYFQKTKTKLDTGRAFGFVLLPRAAVTAEEKAGHKAFCELMLASLDFMTPGAVADTAPADVLATYWPIVGSREPFEIIEAFRSRNCDDLLAWYDHSLARKIAAKAGVAELGGPLLITWPSGRDGADERDPLVVDFSRADYVHATKTLQYWFRQLKNRPELWTDRIREGTIRAELADAVNDTAGVVLAVMSGKWESLKTVATP